MVTFLDRAFAPASVDGVVAGLLMTFGWRQCLWRQHDSILMDALGDGRFAREKV